MQGHKKIRLQTFLSRAGAVSRRGAVSVIKAGKVSVNSGNITEPSFRIDPEKDKVFLNNKRIAPLEKIYIMLNKPKGVTTTKKDPFAKKTVMDLLPSEFSHLNPVGRLDKDTKGLLLLTNDGELINKLTHPGFNIEKRYIVKLDKGLNPREMRVLEAGVMLDGRRTAPCSIRLKGDGYLEIIIHEGRKRQIKRMFAKLGYSVTELKRVSEGSLDIGVLSEGRWRFLTKEEIEHAVK